MPAWLLRDSLLGNLQLKRLSSRLIPEGKSAFTWLSPRQPAVFIYFQTTDWLAVESVFLSVAIFMHVQITFKDVKQVPSLQSYGNDVLFEASAHRTLETPTWLREIDAPGANSAPTRDRCTLWTGRTGQRGLPNMGQSQSYEDESSATRRMPRRVGDGIKSHPLSSSLV